MQGRTYRYFKGALQYPFDFGLSIALQIPAHGYKSKLPSRVLHQFKKIALNNVNSSSLPSFANMQ